MIVLFLIVLFSNTTVKCQPNSTQLKSQIRKTVSHVHDMLAEIEGKIESEKKLLSQINHSLNIENEPPGFLDYEVTDIWGRSTNPSRQRYYKNMAKKYKTGNCKRGTGRVKNEPTIFDPYTFKLSSPSLLRHSSDTSPTRRSIITLVPQSTTEPTTTTTTGEPFSFPPGFSIPGAPEGWVPFQGKTTTLKPIIKELKGKMSTYQIGYFSVFVHKYAEWIGYKKRRADAQKIIFATLSEVRRLLDSGNLNAMGISFCNGIRYSLFVIPEFTERMTQQLAQVLAVSMLRKQGFPEEVHKALQFYDSLVTPSEGEALFEAIELLENYPESEKSELAVVQEMANKTLLTLQRIQGTRNHRKLVSLVNIAVRELNPEMRAGKIDEQSGFVMDHKLSNVSEPENLLLSNMSALPSRRSMGHNIKKIMRHFLVRHPKLFKSFNRHYKRNKKRNRHKSHKRHHHHYHKRHGRHMKHKRKRSRTRTRTRPSTRPTLRPTPRPSLHPSLRPSLRPSPSPSPHPNPRPSLKQPPRPFLRPARVLNKKNLFNKQINLIKQRTFRKNTEDDKYVDSSASEAFYREPNKKDKKVFTNNNLKKPLSTISLPKLSNNINSDILKYLSKKLLLKKKNKIYFRRFMSASKEALSFSQLEKEQTSNNVNDINVIREVSSYSDEEQSLLTNLYDALRHGNRSFPQFRVDSHNDDKPTDIIRDISSGTDEECIIKNNIYKVFEHSQENKLEK